jgi:hypothetical protein
MRYRAVRGWRSGCFFFLVVSRWNLMGGWFPIFFRDIGGLIGEGFDVVEEVSEMIITL